MPPTKNRSQPLADAIREARIQTGRSLRDVARAIRMSPTYLCHVETGKAAAPTEKRLRALAAELHANADLWILLAGRVPGDVVEVLRKYPLLLGEIRARGEGGRYRAIPNAEMQTTPTNCFAACVATVLNIPVDGIPGCDGASWNWDMFQAWLSGHHGLQAIEMTFGSGGTLYPVAAPVRCIITGKSPRECVTGRHAVVADFVGLDGFALLHDPHESQAWIDGDPTHVVFFVPLDPTRLIRETAMEARSE